nr:B-cell receptor CD22-like [Labrus bergylta]
MESNFYSDFNPTHVDHEKNLQCSVRYKGGKHQTESKKLNVKYAPVNVKVEYKSEVKEGESVRMECSSDANPPASYEWHNETGAQLFHGKVYTLHNASRHTGALYCTAINTIARNKSSPVQLNVLHAPEIEHMAAAKAMNIWQQHFQSTHPISKCVHNFSCEEGIEEAAYHPS